MGLNSIVSFLYKPEQQEKGSWSVLPRFKQVAA
jgi:hypothetical protein